MYGTAKFTKLSTALLVVLAMLSAAERDAALAQSPSGEEKARLARLAGEWTKSNPRARTTANARPVVKDNLCPAVAPKEREALGLPAPTWVAADGKVQKAVRAALQEQKKLIESADPMVEFQGDRPVGFRGTAYVDVYLRHERKSKPKSGEAEAAVKEAQARMLRKLTAAEFSLVFAFTRTAGLVGYVNDAGLTKLLDDPDVVAVGLDDQPRPEDPVPATKDLSSETTDDGVAERNDTIDVSVYRALSDSKDGYVFVYLSTADVPLGAGTFESEYRSAEAARRQVEDHVLSTLTAEEFKCRARGVGIAGFANRSGLEKLSKHPEVRAGELLTPVKFFGSTQTKKQ